MKNSPDFGQMGFFETKKNKYIKTFDLFENLSDKLSPELQQFLKIMDLEFPNQCNNLPLRTASGLGDLNVVKELLKHPSVDPSDMNNNALRNAAQEGKIDVIKELLNDPRVDPNVYGDMPLRLTAEGGYYDATVELLKDPRVNPKNVIFENIEDEEIRGLLLKIKNVPSVLRKKYLESGLSDDEKSDVSDFGDFGFFEGHIMNFKKMFESKHGLVEILLKYLKEYSQPGEHYWNDEVDQSFNDLVKLYPDFKVEIRDLEEQITSLSTDFEDIENEEDWIDQENYDQKYEKIKRKIESLIVRKDNPDLTNYGFFDSKNQNLNDLNNFTLNESAIEKRAINSLSNFNFFFVKISESYPLIFVTYSSYNLTIDHEKNELKIKNENLNWSKIYEFKSTFSMFLFLGNINVKLLELISKKILDLNSDIDEMWDFKFTEIREIIANVKRILSEESDFKDMGFFD